VVDCCIYQDCRTCSYRFFPVKYQAWPAATEDCQHSTVLQFVGYRYISELALILTLSDKDGGIRYKAAVRDSIKSIIAPEPESSDHLQNTSSFGSAANARKLRSAADTVVYPLVQMGPFSVNVDEYITSRLLQSSLPGVTMYLASGYLNLVDKYRYSIIHQCAASIAILTAAPEVSMH